MKTRTSDAVEILRRRVGDDPEMKALIAEARAKRKARETRRLETTSSETDSAQ